MKTSSLLIDDLPLQLLPRLAVKIGLNEAVILQQIHFLLKMAKGGREISGHKWVWNTIEAWRSECFPFFSTRTIERAIKNLEDKKLLLSCQPDGRMSRKKYYRVNYDALERLNREPAKMAESIPTKRRVPHPDKMAASKTETTSENSGTENTLSKGTAVASQPDDNVNFDSTWKPNSDSKEQKLAKLRPPENYPTERQFDYWLQENGVDHIINFRDDLYRDLCLRKWHHWYPKSGKWKPIADWRKYVLKLNEKMDEAHSQRR